LTFSLFVDLSLAVHRFTTKFLFVWHAQEKPAVSILPKREVDGNGKRSTQVHIVGVTVVGETLGLSFC